MVDIIPYASSSKGNMYLLKNEDTNILLEIGVNEIEMRKYLLSEGLMITDITAAIVSHYHSDHIKSYQYVSNYMPVYSTIQAKEIYGNIGIEPTTPFKIGSIKVLPIPVEHGEAENNAFIFMDRDNCIFFGTDFSIMSFNISNFKINKCYIEMNYDDDRLQNILDNPDEDNFAYKHKRQISTHMSKENCKIHLHNMDLSNCKEIILLHRSSFLLSRQQAINEIESEFKIHTTFAKEK